jgi:hypothetical protein
VTFAETTDGLPFAYRPREVLTTSGAEALTIARTLFPDAQLEEATIGPFSRLTNIDDPVLLVEELRLHGIISQPNHVYFSHSGVSGNPVYGSPVYGSPVYGSPVYGSPVYGSPVYGSPVYGSPVYGSPVYGSPVYGSPVYGSPVYGSPVYGSPVYGSSVAGTSHTEPTHSSALPPPRHTQTTALGARIHRDLVAGSPRVIVLDTGLAAEEFRPGMLGSGISPADPADIDFPDEDDDEYLDPTAGHGTFIAGVIAQIAPGCEITVHRVLSTFGDGDEWEISRRIRHLVIAEPDRTILSLSFGGYVLDEPFLMAWTIRRIQHSGVHVVASAGNDATSRPAFPAALPGVVAVGALGPNGPAWFTNYGEWVDACAPGSDLLSSFFVFDGPAEVGPYGDDPDDFDGWAQWSGTSFAAPVVVGNLVRLMMAEGISTHGAIRRVIDNPALLRIPGLGTVVDAL